MAAANVRNHGGLLSPEMIPGGFYIATCVGGFADSTTGAKWSGPRAIVDPLTRQVIGLCDYPEPKQLFTHKRVRNPKDPSEFIEIGFDEYDAAELSDGIKKAIDVSLLQHIPDDEVRQYHPQVWAARQERYVYDPAQRNKPLKPLQDLLQQAKLEAHAALDAARESTKAAHNAAAQATAK